jgi:hypothetical protein
MTDALPYFTDVLSDDEDLAMADTGEFVPVSTELRRRAELGRRRPGLKPGYLQAYDALGRWPVVRDGSLVGCSDTTPQKCEEAGAIFRRAVQICDNVARKYAWPKLMLDCNSGPGGFIWEREFGNPFSRVVMRGTPLRELMALNHSRARDTWHVGYVDVQPEHCADLQRRIDEARRVGVQLPADIEVICGDNAAMAPDWVKRTVTRYENAVGMVVHDANAGITSELLAPLGELPQLRRVDFLIYVPAAKLKWHGQDIERILQLARKSRWLLGPIRAHWQHLWMMGVNWDGYPDYRRLGFVWWDSPEGQDRWQKITQTAAQRRAA